MFSQEREPEETSYPGNFDALGWRRRLQNIIDRQETQLKAAWTSTKAAQAMTRVFATKVHVLELENKRLRRALR